MSLSDYWAKVTDMKGPLKGDTPPSLPIGFLTWAVKALVVCTKNQSAQMCQHPTDGE